MERIFNKIKEIYEIPPEVASMSSHYDAMQVPPTKRKTGGQVFFEPYAVRHDQSKAVRLGNAFDSLLVLLDDNLLKLHDKTGGNIASADGKYLLRFTRNGRIHIDFLKSPTQKSKQLDYIDVTRSRVMYRDIKVNTGIDSDKTTATGSKGNIVRDALQSIFQLHTDYQLTSLLPTITQARYNGIEAIFKEKKQKFDEKEFKNQMKNIGFLNCLSYLYKKYNTDIAKSVLKNMNDHDLNLMLMNELDVEYTTMPLEYKKLIIKDCLTLIKR